jgi:hypothetical protein
MGKESQAYATITAPHNSQADVSADEDFTKCEDGDACCCRCPECGEPGVNLNVGRDHWFICFEHRVRWRVGSNLTSQWKDESLAVRNRNRTILKTIFKGYPQINRRGNNRNSKTGERAPAQIAPSLMLCMFSLF